MSTLLFSHVPKTAGTSLRSLAQAHTPDVVFAYEGQLALGNPDLAFMQRFRAGSMPRLVMGHFSYGVHRLLGIAPRYVTVLRDPIERIVSLYRYQKTLPSSPFAEHFRQGMSLKDFVQSGITEQTNNHMARICAGIPPDAGLVLRDSWLLGCALHNVRRHYVLVGRQDNLNEFLRAFAGMLGWPPLAMPHENRTVGPPVHVDPATDAVLRDYNALDLELFDRLCADHDAHGLPGDLRDHSLQGDQAASLAG